MIRDGNSGREGWDISRHFAWSSSWATVRSTHELATQMADVLVETVNTKLALGALALLVWRVINAETARLMKPEPEPGITEAFAARWGTQTQGRKTPYGAQKKIVSPAPPSRSSEYYQSYHADLPWRRNDIPLPRKRFVHRQIPERGSYDASSTRRRNSALDHVHQRTTRRPRRRVGRRSKGHRRRGRYG